MANIYDEIDAQWTWNGDYSLGRDSDLADTSHDGLLSLRQELHDICASEIGDWLLYLGRGATLSDFLGEPNIRSTGDSLHDRLRSSILSAGLVVDADLQLRVVPVHRHKVLIVIQIDAVATPLNRLQDDRLVAALLFDFMEQSTVFLDKVPLLTSF
jgi:hypothetical protein